MGVRETARVQREARVLAAARQLFSQQGFEATSVRDIAGLAGVGVGTVMNAGTKAELLERMFDENQTVALIGTLASLGPVRPGRSFADEADEVFARWFEALDADERLVREYLLSLLSAPYPRARLDRQAVDVVARRILHHRPDMPPATAEDLAIAVYTTYGSMLAAVLSGMYDRDEARATAHRVVTTITARG